MRSFSRAATLGAALCSLSVGSACTSQDDASCLDGKCDEGDCKTPGVALVSAFPDTPIAYPVSMKQSPDPADARFYIVQKGGSILAIEPAASVLDKPRRVETILDLTRDCKFPVEGACVYRQNNGELGWEEGMLDVAFHPDFPQNRSVFVTYIAGRGDTMIWRLSRFSATGSGSAFSIDRNSEQVMIADRKPEDTHNGGALAFGPDRLLYASVGDGGGVLSEQAQNVNTIFGSVLRLDVDRDCGARGYGIPADNPFAAADLGAQSCDLSGQNGRPEIYAWGIRNPWRMSFDRETGDLWEAEIGQDSREEINLIQKGKNYGYPMLEANLMTPKARPGLCQKGCDRLQAPEVEIFHEGQANTPPGAPVGNSVTGGYVYRPDAKVKGEPRLVGLEGHYIYGDFMTTELWAYKRGGKPFVLARTGKRVAAFGQDRQGNLYILDHQSAGGLYKLIAGPCQVVTRPENFYAFLSRDGVGTPQDALEYYKANGIDPLTYTLDQFEREFMGVQVASCFAESPPTPCREIAKSYYKNAMDLGFWREMYCTKSIAPGKGGCMVRNWREEEDLELIGAGSLANLGTVAMNVSPEGFTRFYAFAPDGKISPVAVLDSEGPKAIPNLCTPCHGGTRWVAGAASADLGSIFREFEPSLFNRRDGGTAQFPGINEAQYDKELFDLNMAVLSANKSLRSEADGAPADFDKWKAGVIDYIDNDLYESKNPANPISREANDPAHIPESWATGGTDGQVAAKEQLWMDVVHPYCMGCHRANTKNFAEYANFVGLSAVQGNRSLLAGYTGGNKKDRARALAFMPQAELMFDNLAAGKAGQLQLDVQGSIRQWLQQVTNPNGPVCDINFTVRAPTKPGQEVFIAGSIGTLGEWEPQNGLPLTFSRCVDTACNASEWNGTVSLLRGSRVEFKATMLRFNTGGPPTAIWEEAIANRVVDVARSASAVCEQSVTLTFNAP